MISAMRSLVSAILYGALLTVVVLPATHAGVLELCELREEDGLQCECRDNEANCEVTRPLIAFGPAAHRSRQPPPAEAAKRRRDARTVNISVLIHFFFCILISFIYFIRFDHHLLQDYLVVICKKNVV